MNKWQIICPAIAIAIVVVAMALKHSKTERDYFIQSATYSAGQNMLATTNLSPLVRIDPDVQTKLSEFFISPTHIATVLLGDEPSPIGNGKACSRLVLTNEVGERVVIRFGQTETPGTFRVLGYRKTSN